MNILVCTLLLTVTSCLTAGSHDAGSAVQESCLQLHSELGVRQSGHYQLNKGTAYCDMELECGGHTGGWTRIVSLNTNKDETSSCPTGWISDYNNQNGRHYCTGGQDAGCYSVKFSTHQLNYRRMCGKLSGYQRGSMNAFYPAGNVLGTATGYQPENASSSINGAYVDGISITSGDPRKHVWTYAVGLSDDYRYNYTRGGGYNCPCAVHPGPDPPSFVGEHYYCESGNVGRYTRGKVYSEDMLWDGSGCSSNNNCCTRPGLPWFFRQFPVPITGDIEVRICRDQNGSDEEVLLEEMYIYIQ